MRSEVTNLEYNVSFIWDEESLVWIATSEEIEGLALESGSFDALIERLKYAIPELLELNGQPQAEKINIYCDRTEKVMV